jgi:hypothetical protein
MRDRISQRCRKWISEEEKGRILESRLRPPEHADLSQLRYRELQRSQLTSGRHATQTVRAAAVSIFEPAMTPSTEQLQTDLRPQFPLQHG